MVPNDAQITKLWQKKAGAPRQIVLQNAGSHPGRRGHWSQAASFISFFSETDQSGTIMEQDLRKVPVFVEKKHKMMPPCCGFVKVCQLLTPFHSSIRIILRFESIHISYLYC